MEQRRDFLNGLVSPGEGYEGRWENGFGQVTVRRDPDGDFAVSAAAGGWLAARWVCEYKGKGRGHAARRVFPGKGAPLKHCRARFARNPAPAKSRSGASFNKEEECSVLGTEKIRLPDLLGRSCSGSATPDPQSLLPPLPPTHTQIAVVRISSRTADGDEAISSFGQQPPPDAQLAMTSVINRRQGTTRRPRQRGRERATPSVLPRRTMRRRWRRASDGSQKWIPPPWVRCSR